MTKQAFAERHGIIIRPMTDADRAEANSDRQRACKYIVYYHGPAWYFPKAPTMANLKRLVEREQH